MAVCRRGAPGAHRHPSRRGAGGDEPADADDDDHHEDGGQEVTTQNSRGSPSALSRRGDSGAGRWKRSHLPAATHRPAGDDTSVMTGLLCSPVRRLPPTDADPGGFPSVATGVGFHESVNISAWLATPRSTRRPRSPRCHPSPAPARSPLHRSVCMDGVAVRRRRSGQRVGHFPRHLVCAMPSVGETDPAAELCAQHGSKHRGDHAALLL